MLQVSEYQNISTVIKGAKYGIFVDFGDHSAGVMVVGNFCLESRWCNLCCACRRCNSDNHLVTEAGIQTILTSSDLNPNQVNNL
jgi:hypothetical protein